MNLIDRISYHTWNIGFIEDSIYDVVGSKNEIFHVNWLRHNYKDRFFADPFILSINESIIEVLVEDFPYYDKRGMISLLRIDRNTYELLDRKVILKQPYHMSYPFIQRNNDGSISWVAPEASMSGKLFRYMYNSGTEILEQQLPLVNEPLLDSTIIEFQGIFWLFCTKRGEGSNSELFIYYSSTPEGPWTPHSKNPVVSDASMARPAGNMIVIDGTLYRVIQKCDHHYGEAINISKVDILNETGFKETYIKEIRAQKDSYSECFHTINGLDNVCVVDGVKVDFRPIKRLWYEIRNRLHI